jgi:hypothetical protein
MAYRSLVIRRSNVKRRIKPGKLTVSLSNDGKTCIGKAFSSERCFTASTIFGIKNNYFLFKEI